MERVREWNQTKKKEGSDSLMGGGEGGGRRVGDKTEPEFKQRQTSRSVTIGSRDTNDLGVFDDYFLDFRDAQLVRKREPLEMGRRNKSPLWISRGLFTCTSIGRRKS